MQKVKIDFDNPGLPQHISAMESDSQSRFFEATLYQSGKAYTAPAGVTYSIMYRGFGPQNQGWYDTINDGSGKRAACTVSGNVVTCEIARQALQVPGNVDIVLCVTGSNGYMIKSWPIACACKNDHYDSTAEVESFFYITSVSNESWTQAIQAAQELKNVIDTTLSISGKAADAKTTGDSLTNLNTIIFDISPEILHTTHTNSIVTEFGTIIDATGWEANEYSVSPMQVVALTGEYGYQAVGYALYLGDTFISYKYTESNEIKSFRDVLTIPLNCTKIIVNGRKQTYATIIQDVTFKPTNIRPGFYKSDGSFETDTAVSAEYFTFTYNVSTSTLINANIFWGFDAVGASLFNNDSLLSTLFIDSNNAHSHQVTILTPNNCNKIALTLSKSRKNQGQVSLPTTDYSNVKWCALGDSLTEVNFRSDCNYYKYALGILGMTYYRNLGVSGTGYANADDKFYSRIDAITNVDFDVMTIFGSGNDLSSGLPLGTYTDENTTSIAGCVNKAITSFYNKAPTKKLAIITPTPWDNYCKGNLSGEMENYSNMLITIAKYRGVPCLDLFHKSGIRPWNSEVRAAYYHGDGVHPNEEGHYCFIVPQVLPFLKSLIN